MIFIWFFIPILFLYYLLPAKATKPLLLISSYLFYAWWDWRFLGLIVFITVVNFYMTAALNKQTIEKRRNLLLLICIITSFSVLGVFKYFNFFIDSFVDLLSYAGFQSKYSYINIILPVGISFYTFQAVSYTIDVWKKDITPETDIIAFAIFIAFFPKLLAGPIERAGNFLPQIKEKKTPMHNTIGEALWLILWGFFLKVLIADNLCIYVDSIYDNYQTISGIDVILCHYAFAFQIFGDFAGYSYIAIGIAKLFGINLSENFRFPYFAKTPSEFWQNWHISLSNWFRDYLYIPLGGNKNSKIITLRNLMITMTVCGLWHGAAWHFVLWGTFHGIVLVLFRIFSTKSTKTIKSNSFRNMVQVFCMFHITCFGWMIFRTPNMKVFFTMIHKLLFDLTNFDTNFDIRTGYWGVNILFYISILVTIQLFQFVKKIPHSMPLQNPLLKPILSVTMVYLLLTLGNWGTKSFIYLLF